MAANALAKAAPKNLSAKQLQRVWEELKPPALFEQLRLAAPNNRWSLSGSRISGCCPIHDDSTPSFHIYVDRQYAKCFGCDAYIWNPLELWARVKRISRVDALTDLRSIFGVKFLSNSASTQFQAWERHQLLKKRIADICHDELINAVNEPSKADYLYAQPAVKYLLGTRKMPVDAIPALGMLGILPPLARIVEILEAEAASENHKRAEEAARRGEKVELFTPLTEEAKDYLTPASGWVGAILFRLDVSPSSIGRFKLRRPNTKDFYIVPDAYEDDLGFLGLGWRQYQSMFGSQQKYCWPYVVEGEFDALSLMAHQVVQGGPTFIVLSAGGAAGGQALDDLQACGFSDVYLVGDAPEKKGNELIESWLPHVKKIRARIFIGHGKFPGAGDSDEAVQQYGIDAVQKVLLDVDNKALFQNPPDWVFDRASEDLEPVDAGDIRQRIEIASNWGRVLKNNIDCDTYVGFCEKVHNLPAIAVKREIVAHAEDEPAFILRVADVLSQVFYVVGQQAFDSDRRLHLWHRQMKRAVTVSLADDGSIERELGAVLGPTYQFFQEKIGVPSFVDAPAKQKAAGKFLQELDRNLRWYVRQALIILARGAPDFDMAEQKGQGFHVIFDKLSDEPRVYLINGRDVYAGGFNEKGGLAWTALEGPSTADYIFDIGQKTPASPWLPHVTQVSDLERAPQIQLRGIFDDVVRYIDAGWRFKNHALTTEFLAAHLMATTISQAFKRSVSVAFHADTSAGKSKMVLGLIGGRDFPDIHLLLAASPASHYSEAGVRQEMSNRGRPLCLDEFEDTGTNEKKAKAVRAIMEMLRNSTGADNVVLMGSKNGTPIKAHLNFNVFMAAITKPRAKQDLNRIISISMERVEGKDDPVQILQREFGAPKIKQMREDLAIAMYPRVREAYQAYAQLKQEYSKANSRPIKMDARLFEALLPAVAVMKIMGLDYRKFVTDFCTANQESWTELAGHTDSSDLFSWILNSPKIKTRVGEDWFYVPLTQLLATAEGREAINTTGCGLYYDEDSQILVANWIMCVQTVLSDHAQYNRETNVSNVRELASRVSFALRTEELEKSGVLQKLRRYGLGALSATQVTGFHIGHLVRANTDAPKNPKTKVVENKKEETNLADDGSYGI